MRQQMLNRSQHSSGDWSDPRGIELMAASIGIRHPSNATFEPVLRNRTPRKAKAERLRMDAKPRTQAKAPGMFIASAVLAYAPSLRTTS